MYTIYCFWTEDNLMSDNRLANLKQLREKSGCSVQLITPYNLPEYILPSEPIHAAYEYLSATHKADYLRTYFMNFYGGGYSDIKQTSGSWISAFLELYDNEGEYWICGYKETSAADIGYKPVAEFWNELIGNGAYICKPQTDLTKDWYQEMLDLLDKKLPQLRKYPAKHPQDASETGSGYPLGWNELLGRIFHRICYNYKNFILSMLPIPVMTNYR